MTYAARVRSAYSGPATGPIALLEALVRHEAEVRVPAIVGAFEQRYGICCRRGRCCVGVVHADRRALGGHVQPLGRAVLAVHVDQVPHAPGNRRERFGIGARQRPIGHPGAVGPLPDRPAAGRRFPEVLRIAQSVDARPDPLPDVVRQSRPTRAWRPACDGSVRSRIPASDPSPVRHSTRVAMPGYSSTSPASS